MKCNPTIGRNGMSAALIVSVIVFSGVDAFGQFRRTRPNVRPAARESLKAEIILESNTSARTEWQLETTRGGPPTRKVLKDANMPGAPVVVSWDFGEMSRSPADRTAKFMFRFSDGDYEYETDFTFYPRDGKVRFEYNAGVGSSWDFDKEGSTNLTPTKRTLSPSPRGMAGVPTKEEWTLGKILDGKDEGTVVFRFNFRGNVSTEAKVKVRK